MNHTFSNLFFKFHITGHSTYQSHKMQILPTLTFIQGGSRFKPCLNLRPKFMGKKCSRSGPPNRYNNLQLMFNCTVNVQRTIKNRGLTVNVPIIFQNFWLKIRIFPMFWNSEIYKIGWSLNRFIALRIRLDFWIIADILKLQEFVISTFYQVIL